MMKLVIATQGSAARRYALLNVHHLACDHRSLGTIVSETLAYLNGDERSLPEPATYRSYVEDIITRTRADSGEAFFRQKLGDVAEPTAAFGLVNVHEPAAIIEEVRADVSTVLSEVVRATGRQLSVSPARLFHAAFGLVVSRTSGRDDVVYGTVVLTGQQRRARTRGIVGMTVNTLPLRLKLVGLSATEYLAQTHRELSELLRYDHVQLATAQRCSGLGPSVSPFNTLFNFRHSARGGAPAFTGAAGIRVLQRGEAWSNYPVAVTVDDFGDKFSLIVQTDSQLSGHRIAEYLCTALQSLADALVNAPTTPVHDLAVIPSTERHSLLEKFNDTCTQYPSDEPIHELFELQVERSPDSVALVCDGHILTYAVLNRMANQLAHYLARKGFHAGDPVPLVMPRSRDMIVAQLAVLKLGGTYVPVDPQFPVERQLLIIRDCGAHYVLLQQAHLNDFELPGTEKIGVEAALTASQSLPRENLRLRALSPAPAYIMYTSGSTGTPKGVMVPHHAVNRLVFNNNYAQIEARDCVAHTSNPAFDASTFEIWGALLTGARLLIVPQEALLDGRRFADILLSGQVTILWITVGLLKQHLDALCGVLSQLRYLITGGDVVEPALIRRIAPDRRPRHLLNAYGPTECTTFSTTYDVSVLDGNAVNLPIGRPIANTRVYILDQYLRPAPIGVAGEIYIGGDGVGLGYVNRPELTAKRFLSDPFHPGSNARMYRSGDLGRWRADGNIEFLGRNDLQVKIRGFRIELGEIEDHLHRHPRIKEAVVVAREDVKGDRRLAAYVKCKDPGDHLCASPEELREYLKGRIPGYMVPSAFVLLEEFPLTANGKIDRRALPVPELGAYSSREYEPPRGEVEEVVTGIWQRLLRIDRVSRHDNFFELGGNSLLIVQMVEHLRRVGLSAEVRRILECPILADLATELVTGAVGRFEIPPNLIPPKCETITPQMLPLLHLEPEHIANIAQAVPGGMANIQDIYPLTPLQEGMLFHHLLGARDCDTYVVHLLFSLESRSRLQDFVGALQHVIDRHDALRTAVLWERLPQPIQVVHRRATLPVEEISLESERETVDQLRARMTPKGQLLDLTGAPLMRLRTAPDRHGAQWYALLQLHHLVCDNISLRTMLREVMAFLEGDGTLLRHPIAYRKHVAQILSRSRTTDYEAYFRGKFCDFEEPTAAFGLKDARDGAIDAESAHEVIAPNLTIRIRTQAGRLGVSAATLFHSAWSLVVSCASACDDIVFGSVLLGRLQGGFDAQRSLGMFINTLPLRLRLCGLSANELVERTQRELFELMSYEDASLAVAQRCSGIPGASPLFSTLLNYRHGTLDLADEFRLIHGVKVLATKSWTNYPVMMSVDERDDGFTLTAQTDRRSIDPSRIVGYMRQALQSLVDALDSSPDTEALSLPILPECERREVLSVFNATAQVYPTDAVVHQLFEQQVLLSPGAVAVEHQGRTLTYAELNSKANHLARHLRNHGIGPDETVGLCAARGLEMVIGLLGILKAGGAFVPLDPSYPAPRLQHMLDDAAPRVVLTQRELVPLLPATHGEVIALDEWLQEIAGNAQENLSVAELGLNPQHLIYVIYTSGSTGRPKGTAMAHGSMVNLLTWHSGTFGRRLGVRVLQFAALSFDVAFQETFSTLCTGGTLVLLDEWVRRDPQALTEFLRNHSVQRLFVPPLMLQSLAECTRTTGVIPETLEDIITAGDQLRISPEVVSFFSHLRGCRLHNHYGPTETHVVTTLTLTGTPSEWPALPSVGRPIANTQIYVLDSKRRPVPIGVTGEIYIGGPSVARGYLGNSELTAQRFPRDPFSGEPDSRLYRTGDLGRWHADGTLEYLGRNDFQTKIRGYRIELGEIEAHLTAHTQIKEAAVIPREDEPGQQRLVAYVTARDKCGPSSEELRAHLKARVPDYMVPSAIVLLKHLPLTPSGKLDRRSLPVPDPGAYASEEYEAPRGEVEEALAAIWQRVLHLQRLGRNDNFFELGGHSLLVIKALVKINASLNCSLRVTDLYQSPSLRELADRISGAGPTDQIVDLSREVPLDGEILASTRPGATSVRSILLTGATGFVGRFLLTALLDESDATVYCLVRATSVREAATRIKNCLTRWNMWRPGYDSRIVPIPGDLTRLRLGMREDDYHIVANEVDSIYHCGASVNHLETYDAAKPANVLATQELLGISTRGAPKPLHYISTLGIFAAETAGGKRVVSEDTPIEHERHCRSNGYLASKWVAENIIMRARDRGVPCNIFRLGLLWADSCHGRFDEQQHVYRLLKSCLLSGCAIENYRYQQAPVPVDHAARSIVSLSARHNGGRGVFHIAAPGQTKEGLFEECNRILHVPLKLLAFPDWITEVRRLHEMGRSLPIVPLIESLFSLDRHELLAYEHRRESSYVHYDCQRTAEALQYMGIYITPLNTSLTLACLQDMSERDPELRTIPTLSSLNHPKTRAFRQDGVAPRELYEGRTGEATQP